MRGQIRIRSNVDNVRRVVELWQTRYEASGAVHFADPSTLLLAADVPVDALESLLRSLQATEVEVIWRASVPPPMIPGASAPANAKAGGPKA